MSLRACWLGRVRGRGFTWRGKESVSGGREESTVVEEKKLRVLESGREMDRGM